VSLETLDLLKAAGPPSDVLDQAEAYDAAASGDIARLKAYLQAGGDPETPLVSDSLISAAGYEHQIESLRILVQAGVTVRVPDDEEERRWRDPAWLLKAALENERYEDDGFLEGIELLITAGIQLNVVIEPKHEPNVTAIGYCVRHELDAAYDLLLKHGADPWLAPERTKSAMWWAAAMGRWSLLDREVPGWRDDRRLLDARVIAYARDGDADALRRMLEVGGDPNAADRWAGSALWCAAKYDHADCARILLEAGADPDWSEGIYCGTPRKEATGQCQDLFREFLTPEAPTVASLFDAIEKQDLPAVKAALDSGVDPDSTRGEAGETALMVAASGGSVAVVDALLDAGAKLTGKSTDHPSNTPLSRAATAGHVAVVRRLLERGHEAGHALSTAITAQDVQALDTLLDAGVDPDLGLNRSRPLLLAVAAGPSESVERLLDHGADPHAVMPKECLTPLYRAVGRRRRDVLGTLLQRGADPNRPGEPEWTPVMLAAQLGDHDLVADLLRASADPDAIHESGATALMLALESGDAAVAAEIVRHSRSVEASDRDLPEAVIAGDLGAIAGCVARGVDLDAPEPGCLATALHVAVLLGHREVTIALLDAGAKADPRDYLRRTPLHWAAQRSDVDLVQLLLERGASLDAVDVDGLTALHLAIDGSPHSLITTTRALVNGDRPQTGPTAHDVGATIHEILDRGIGVDLVDRRGHTALHYASAIDDRDLVAMLLAAGADVSATADDGSTPLDLCASREMGVMLSGDDGWHPRRTDGDDDDNGNDSAYIPKRLTYLPDDPATMLELALPARRRLPLGGCRFAVVAMVAELRRRLLAGDTDAVRSYAAVGAALFRYLVEAPNCLVIARARRSPTRKSLELVGAFARMMGGDEL
jgi:ankyrin repeat protein